MRSNTGGAGLVLTLAVLSATLAAGCMRGMALAGKPEALDTRRESVALLTLKTSNQYKPFFQPNVRLVHIWADDEFQTEYTFRVQDPHERAEERFNEYLLSFSLAPGRYTLREIVGDGSRPLVPVSGFFTVPVFTKFELKPNAMVYLGRIEATLRERKDDGELRAGSALPAIDQAVTGFYSGTFDIRTFDNYDDDMAVFRQKYPALQRFTVERAVLPPWTKPSKEQMRTKSRGQMD